MVEKKKRPENPLVVIVTPKAAYGREDYVPENDVAIAFAKLLKCTNLSKAQLKILKNELGYRILFKEPDL